jgi:5,10-methylenetetrahydromethanopterin reductase
MAISQQALTVSAASEGRLTLGIGLSHKVVIETMMGMSYDKPIRHIRDYLSILGPLSQGQSVSYAGEDYTTHGVINAATVEFPGNPDEAAATREAVTSLIG